MKRPAPSIIVSDGILRLYRKKAITLHLLSGAMKTQWWDSTQFWLPSTMIAMLIIIVRWMALCMFNTLRIKHTWGDCWFVRGCHRIGRYHASTIQKCKQDSATLGGYFSVSEHPFFSCSSISLLISSSWVAILSILSAQSRSFSVSWAVLQSISFL